MYTYAFKDAPLQNAAAATHILQGLHPFDVSQNVCIISFPIVTSLMFSNL